MAATCQPFLSWGGGGIFSDELQFQKSFRVFKEMGTHPGVILIKANQHLNTRPFMNDIQSLLPNKLIFNLITHIEKLKFNVKAEVCKLNACKVNFYLGKLYIGLLFWMG